MEQMICNPSCTPAEKYFALFSKREGRLKHAAHLSRQTRDRYVPAKVVHIIQRGSPRVYHTKLGQSHMLANHATAAGRSKLSDDNGRYSRIDIISHRRQFRN